MSHFDEHDIHTATVPQGRLASEGPQLVYGAEERAENRSEIAPIALPSGGHLEVDHRADHDDAPEVRAVSWPKYSVGDAGNPTRVVTNAPTEPQSESLVSAKPATMICELRRRTFWILVVLANIVILGGAIGGGVGGTLARRNNRDQNPTPPAIATTSSTQPSTTTISSNPSATSNTGPRMEFSMQIWESSSFIGRSQIFYTPGFYHTAFLARSYMWKPGRYDLDNMQVCSMAYCLGSNKLGWRGSSTRENPGYPENATWGADNIVITCATSFVEPPCPGPLAMSTFATAPVIETTISTVQASSLLSSPSFSSAAWSAASSAAWSAASSAASSLAPSAVSPPSPSSTTL